MPSSFARWPLPGRGRPEPWCQGPAVRDIVLRNGNAALRLGLADDRRLQVRHDIYDGRTLGPPRFAQKYSGTRGRADRRGAGCAPDRAAVSRARCRSRRPAAAGRLLNDGLPQAPGQYDLTLLVAAVETRRRWAGRPASTPGREPRQALKLSAHCAAAQRELRPQRLMRPMEAQEEPAMIGREHRHDRRRHGVGGGA